MKTLIAADGTDYSKNAVRKYCELTDRPGPAEIMIVSVTQEVIPLDAFPHSEEYSRAMEKAARREAEKYVSEAEGIVRENIKDRVVDITTRVLTGVPAQVITKAAKEWEADLIVVGSHGKGVWSRALLGSVSDAITHHAPCSVLVVRS